MGCDNRTEGARAALVAAMAARDKDWLRRSIEAAELSGTVPKDLLHSAKRCWIDLERWQRERNKIGEELRDAINSRDEYDLRTAIIKAEAAGTAAILAKNAKALLRELEVEETERRAKLERIRKSFQAEQRQLPSRYVWEETSKIPSLRERAHDRHDDDYSDVESIGGWRSNQSSQKRRAPHWDCTRDTNPQKSSHRSSRRSWQCWHPSGAHSEESISDGHSSSSHSSYHSCGHVPRRQRRHDRQPRTSGGSRNGNSWRNSGVVGQPSKTERTPRAHSADPVRRDSTRSEDTDRWGENQWNRSTDRWWGNASTSAEQPWHCEQWQRSSYFSDSEYMRQRGPGPPRQTLSDNEHQARQRGPGFRIPPSRQSSGPRGGFPGFDRSVSSTQSERSSPGTDWGISPRRSGRLGHDWRDSSAQADAIRSRAERSRFKSEDERHFQRTNRTMSQGPQWRNTPAPNSHLDHSAQQDVWDAVWGCQSAIRKALHNVAARITVHNIPVMLRAMQTTDGLDPPTEPGARALLEGAWHEAVLQEELPGRRQSPVIELLASLCHGVLVGRAPFRVVADDLATRYCSGDAVDRTVMERNDHEMPRLGPHVSVRLRNARVFACALLARGLLRPAAVERLVDAGLQGGEEGLQAALELLHHGADHFEDAVPGGRYERYLDQVRTFAEQESTSKRLRILSLNLLELRLKGWDASGGTCSTTDGMSATENYRRSPRASSAPPYALESSE